MYLLQNVIDYIERLELNKVAKILSMAVIIGCFTAYPAAADPGEGTLFGTSGNAGQLISIDSNTGIATPIGGGVGFAAPALARQPLTGTLYAGQGGGSPNIYTVDATTGVATLVGNSGLGFAAIGSLDFRSDGVLFAAVNIAGDGGTGADHLATIDTATGFATVIGPFGTCVGVPAPPVNGAGSCDIDGIEGIAFDSDGQLWGVHRTRGAAGMPGLYSIDAATGTATFNRPLLDVSNMPASGGFVSLQFACDGTTYLGSARALGVGTDGGTLATIPPGGSNFTFATTPATGGSSLAALAFESDCSTAVVEVPANPLDPVLFFAAADDPNSVNPLTASFQQVLVGGTVQIDCCSVVDTREGAGRGGKFGTYRPGDFDLGVAMANTPACDEVPAVAENSAILRPWYRAVPPDHGIPDDTGGPIRFGVCVIHSTVMPKGIVFSEENAANVPGLGFEVNCDEDDVDFRPLTGGVALNDPEVDVPFVIPWTGECDRSRSGTDYSDRLMVVNLRHYTPQNGSKPYTSRLAASLKDSIEQVRSAGCVDNGFLDDLKTLVQSAKKDMNKKGDPNNAVETLDDATRLALQIAPHDLVDDPYDACPDNPKGLLVGRLMSLRFAACSELVHPDSFSADPLTGDCKIADDIRAELPPLP